MAVMIREYLNATFRKGYKEMDLKESSTYNPMKASPNALIIDIEGIHVIGTRNFTRYMEEALDYSIPSWTKPYNKPLITHHDEESGDVIGRINSAKKETENTLSGTPALVFNVSVLDKEAIERVKDGRYMTTSVGIIAHEIKCSCCGYDIMDESGCPDHQRGEIYDGEYAYWDIYKMEAKELSFVNVPSDPFAKNIKIYDNKKEPIQLSESTKSGGVRKMKTVEELEILVKELEDEKAKVSLSLSEALEEKKKIEEEKTKSEIALKEANETIAALEIDLQESSEKQKAEVALKEAAEKQYMDLKESIKTDLAVTYNELRKAAGKVELSESVIKTRSTESLKNSIEDLRMELTESKKEPEQVIIKTVADPTITDSEKVSVNKEKSNSNINLEESLAAIFSSAVGRLN